jgi:hypothetical protein
MLASMGVEGKEPPYAAGGIVISIATMENSMEDS